MAGKPGIPAMIKLLKHKNTQRLFRYILGALFILASFDKIVHPQEFSDLIDNYHITPVQLNNLAALFLPWLELLIGIGLITGFFIDGSLIIVNILLVFFILLLTQAVARGIDTHCGCFKTIETAANIDFKMLLVRRILEDVLFLGMAMSLKFTRLSKDKT